MRQPRYALPVVVCVLVLLGSAHADEHVSPGAPATTPEAAGSSNTPKTVLHRAAAATDRGIRKAAAASERGTHKAVEATKRGLNKAGIAMEKAARKTKHAVTGKTRDSKDGS
jgi:hypothetical protein